MITIVLKFALFVICVSASSDNDTEFCLLEHLFDHGFMEVNVLSDQDRTIYYGQIMPPASYVIVLWKTKKNGKNLHNANIDRSAFNQLTSADGEKIGFKALDYLLRENNASVEEAAKFRKYLDLFFTPIQLIKTDENGHFEFILGVNKVENIKGSKLPFRCFLRKHNVRGSILPWDGNDDTVFFDDYGGLEQKVIASDDEKVMNSLDLLEYHKGGIESEEVEKMLENCFMYGNLRELDLFFLAAYFRQIGDEFQKMVEKDELTENKQEILMKFGNCFKKFKSHNMNEEIKKICASLERFNLFEQISVWHEVCSENLNPLNPQDQDSNRTETGNKKLSNGRKMNHKYKSKSRNRSPPASPNESSTSSSGKRWKILKERVKTMEETHRYRFKVGSFKERTGLSAEQWARKKISFSLH